MLALGVLFQKYQKKKQPHMVQAHGNVAMAHDVQMVSSSSSEAPVQMYVNSPLSADRIGSNVLDRAFGAAQPQPMGAPQFCTGCGAPNVSRDRFCGKCGKEFPVETQDKV